MGLIGSFTLSPKIAKNILTLGVPLLLVTAGNYVAFAEQVATTILLDVNPSIEITANEADEVIEVLALNEDAETVLGDMNLENMNIEVAMNAIVGSMVQHGYLDETKNAVLMTVDGEDEAKQSKLEARLTSKIKDILALDDISPVIFSQDADSFADGTRGQGAKAAAFAKEHDISLNKAAFILKILGEDHGLSEKKLVAMNVEALSEVIRSENIDLHDSMAYSDKALAKASEKTAEKANKTTEKQTTAVVKKDEKQADASTQASEFQTKETDKQGAATSQTPERQSEAPAKAEVAQTPSVAQPAAASAPAAEQQAEADANALAAQQQAAEKQAEADAKAAEKQAEADAKAAAKKAEDEAKAAAKQAEADARAAEKQAAADAKANAGQTKGAKE